MTLTASSTTPAPANTFAIATLPGGAPDPATTAANLNAALNTAIGNEANTDLVAASAVAAGNDFFDPSSSAVGSVATNQQTPAAPITSATALSGTAPSDSLAAGFQNGDTITVDGTPITFSNNPTSLTGPSYNINPASGTVGNLLSAIDFDHRHLDALQHRRRRHHAEHRQRRQFFDHGFVHGSERASRAGVVGLRRRQYQTPPPTRPAPPYQRRSRRCASHRQRPPRPRWSTARPIRLPGTPETPRPIRARHPTPRSIPGSRSITAPRPTSRRSASSSRALRFSRR